VVWASLLAAMTAVGGVLLFLEDRPAGAASPLPLLQTQPAPRSNGLSSIFETQVAPEAGRWTGIVIHHSSSAVGSAESLTKQHNDRGYKGLGFHFVISNGQGAPDGQIVVGYRWQSQLPGVHVSGPRAETFNRQSIGICLVGDGERRPFTAAQISRLTELVAELQRKLNIPDHAVVLHRDVAPTSSPGRNFPEVAFRQRLAELE